jgi:hypothetical protein
VLDLVQLLQYVHEFHQDYYKVMIHRIPKKINEILSIGRKKHTSPRARIIFQSSRAFPGGAVAK